MKPKILEFADLDELAREGSKLFAEAGLKAISARGEFVLALAGGKTPRPLYEMIARKSTLPKKQIYLIPGDERCLPLGDNARNQTLLEQSLSTVGNLLSVPAGLDPKLVSLAWESELSIFFEKRPRKNGLPVLDLAILGMGEDGHTASLFPGMLYSEESKAMTHAVENIGDPRVPRVTLSMEFLRNAKERWLVISGEKKIGLIEKILSGDRLANELPAAKVRPTAILLANE